MSRSKRNRNRPIWHPTHWPSWLGVFALYLLALLPMKTKQRFGAWLGRVLERKLWSRRKVADKNLIACMPELTESERDQLIQDNFVACTRGFLESLHAWWRDVSVFCENTHIEGLEHLREAQERGKGVLLIGGHYSIFDFALPLIACHLTKPGYVYRPNGNPVIDWMIERGRRRHFGIQPFTKRELRPMVSFLKNGGEVWFACDQDLGDKTEIFSPFFNMDAPCVTSPTYIARVSRASVIFVSHLRRPDGVYQIRFSTVQEGFGQDVAADTAAWNGYIEQTVREYPDQYLWLHKRFKTRPAGCEPVY